MRCPIRPLRGRWPSWLTDLGRTSRFFRLDPLTILDDDATPEDFRAAMSSIYVGDTIKITGANRHPGTDELLLSTLDLSDARIVDIGASDGTTSVELISKLNGFRSYVIADLYLNLEVVQVGRRSVLFDLHGNCVLVVGPRFAAWPTLSAAVASGYSRLIARARTLLPSQGRTVPLLNPVTRRLIAEDERVTCRVHDVFEVWDGDPPDLIKVANLLRRLYFDDDDLLRALRSVHASLPEGGHLMIVDNPRILDTPPRAGIWRRQGARFELVARTGAPEIADLVGRVGDDQPVGAPDPSRGPAV